MLINNRLRHFLTFGSVIASFTTLIKGAMYSWPVIMLIGVYALLSNGKDSRINATQSRQYYKDFNSTKDVVTSENKSRRCADFADVVLQTNRMYTIS